MTKAEATAGVFMTALKALPRAEREKVMLSIARNRRMLRDLQDLAVFEARRNEPAMPFREYVKQRGKRR